MHLATHVELNFAEIVHAPFTILTKDCTSCDPSGDIFDQVAAFKVCLMSPCTLLTGVSWEQGVMNSEGRRVTFARNMHSEVASLQDHC